MPDTGVATDKQYLRPHQVQETKDEKKRLETSLNNPLIEDRGAVRAGLRVTEERLQTQAPPELKGMQLDAAVKREKELREKITEGMLSQEEMRKSPPGAIGAHMKWEKANKARIMEWKNTRLAINHGTDDPDIANLERYRPTTSHLNMQGAPIEGQQFSIPSEAYKANYDEAFAKVEQSEVEIAELKAQVAELMKQSRKPGRKK